MSQPGVISGPRKGHATGRPWSGLVVVAIVAGMAVTGSAKVKARADFNKAFVFRQAHTWGWNPTGAGQIMAARTADDDKEAVRKLAEPIIFSAVSQEMPKRGLTQATGAPDLTLAYYLLLTIGSSAQTMGQFLPGSVAWGMPPFLAITQSLKIFEQGSLVLDIRRPDGNVVWRGVAQAEMHVDRPDAVRNATLGSVVADILKQFPPKKKK